MKRVLVTVATRDIDYVIAKDFHGEIAFVALNRRAKTVVRTARSKEAASPVTLASLNTVAG